MKVFFSLLISSLFVFSVAQADEGKSSGGASSSGMKFGPYVGLGLPLLGQVGVTIFPTSFLSLDVGYGTVSMTTTEGSDDTSGTDDEAKVTVDLSMPEVILKWHPFLGSFFIGGGVGKEKLTAEGTDETTGEKMKVEVEANTTIVKLGWMWSAQNGGLWWGMDLSYIMPSGAETTITTDLPTNNETYEDVKDDAEDFGEKKWGNITFIKIGYLF